MSSAWLIATKTLGAQDVTVNASPQVIAADERYLYNATNSLSWLNALQAAMLAAGVTTPSVFLTRARKVRITAGSSYTITWTDTELRDLLGFTGNLSSASSHTADNVSPALWSPGYEALPTSPYGTDGYDIPDTLVLSSPSGLTTTMVTHFTATHQELAWDVIPQARVWTSSEAGGEYKRLWSDYLIAGERVTHYQSVNEDETATTTAATLGTGLGPYKLRSINPQWFSRRLDPTDRLWRITLDLIKVSELT
jgi:hypothetical protein